jgi:hypothetical protein
MRSKKISRLLLFFSMLGVEQVGFADPITPIYVVDQNLETQAQNTYNLLNSRIYNAINQSTMASMATSRTVQSSLTGSNNNGLLNNTAADKEFRDWTPTSEDLQNMVAQGLQAGSLADQIKYYNQKFHIPTAAQLSPTNPNSPQASYGVFSAVSTNAALSVADKGFDNVTQIQQQINNLYQQLDRQQTLKQSQDFNSVILLKIAALQTDLIRLQAQQLKIQAVAQQENNLKRTTMAQFLEDVK